MQNEPEKYFLLVPLPMRILLVASDFQPPPPPPSFTPLTSCLLSSFVVFLVFALRFKTEEEAVAVANDTSAGLAGMVSNP